MFEAPHLRFGRFWTSCGMGFVLLVVYLSLNHDPPRTGYLFDIKIGHFLAYGWLMFWFAQIFRSATARLGIAATLCLLGVALEYAQAFTDYRTFAYSDMLDNAIGIGTGALVAFGPLRCSLAAMENVLTRLAGRS